MKNLLLILALTVSMYASAEEPRRHCYNTEYVNQQIQNDPQYQQNRAELENFTREFIRNAQVQRSTNGTIYIIPVVFHILHQYGPENITDEQAIDCVNIMTRDFRKLNPDTVDIIAPFVSIAADCEIEFRLATIDPNGNCTNGIDRIVTNKTYLADDASKLNPWPNNKYLNIWSAYSLLNSAAAAYAHYPGGSNATDGIMSRYDYVGSINSSSPSHARTLTHEIGHYFNLAHVWGSNNTPGIACGDDGVADTPISIGWDHCDLAGSICNPPIIENVQNYMEYSYCDIMFTYGQKARMHAALNSSISGRNNLWTPANLAATGTDGSPITICTPNADFTTNYTNACTGAAITFYDQSWNADVTGWNWSFPGGTPATSTDSNPTVTYSAAGLYSATLIASSVSGSDTILRTNVVRITDTAMTSMPYANDFEDSVSFPGVDGWIDNPDNSSTGLWTRVSNANTTPGGSHALKINNFNNVDGQVDSWITPSIDFTNVTFPINIAFKVANAQRSSTSDDELRVYYSNNCGQSWLATTYNKSGATLSTVGVLTSNFTPTSATQWRQENANANPVQNKPNVRFKFQNTSDRGNNVYVDDISITGVYVGLDEADELQSGFALYPNPSEGQTTLSFSLSKTSKVVVEIKNILGQTISTIDEKTLSAGMYENKLPVLTSGIYLIDVTVNNKHHIRKLIVS